jgi:hypothetical protein
MRFHERPFLNSLIYLANLKDARGMAMYVNAPPEQHIKLWQRIFKELHERNATFFKGEYKGELPNGGMVILDV